MVNMEITIISAEDLRIRGRPINLKKKAFVTLTPDSDSASCDSLRSNVDNNGGSNPLWNHKLHMELASHIRFIRADVYCTSSNSLVGTARIPVADFAGANFLHRLSYRLKDRYGDRNGILNISVNQPASTTPYCSFDSGCGYGCWSGRPNNWIALGFPVSHPCPPIL